MFDFLNLMWYNVFGDINCVFSVVGANCVRPDGANVIMRANTVRPYNMPSNLFKRGHNIWNIPPTPAPALRDIG